MNRILSKSLLIIAVIFSFSHANAQTFGGFKPGQTFTLKVVKRSSESFAGIESNRKARVPNGIPDYKLGQKVKFTIGAKGELKAKGLNMPFETGAGVANVYSNPSTSKYVDAGQVFKKFSNHKPILVILVFNKYRTRGGITAGNAVAYELR